MTAESRPINWSTLVSEFGTRIVLVHHIPGRFRIKFDFFLAFHPEIQKLGDLSKTLPGITQVRMNIWARSLIVEYDKNLYSPALIDELFTSHDQSRKQEIIRQLHHV
jgi:hypothetical protein